MSEIWLSSDQHFGHKNIIDYCNRPFKNTNDMNNSLITNWNSVVNPNDQVFIIGDFSLERNPEKIRSWINRLNGMKHLILGNHDELKPFTYVSCGFSSVHTSYMLGDIYLAHDPAVKIALPKDNWLFHGHIHNLWKVQTENKLINVGVDVWDLKPVNLNILKEIIHENS